MSIKIVGAIELRLEEPTDLSLSDLGEWVLWQYPRFHRGWLCAAAHPPEPQFGWIPARVQPKKERVLLYAHCTDPLTTPEAAAEWIAQQQDL